MMERLSAHFPAGTSVKDMVHYSQFINTKPAFFGRYDYGKASATPPPHTRGAAGGGGKGKRRKGGGGGD